MNDVNRLALIPPLENGDHLTRDEFERRYEAMPELKKVELIEGVVFMPSPVSLKHGAPHSDIVTALGVYRAMTPGTESGVSTTVRLDMGNEPQPDMLLIVKPEFGGKVQIDEKGYIVGAPDLAVEVSSSTASIDLGAKRAAYLRNDVREYLVWRVRDEELDWFVRRNGHYELAKPDSEGIVRSETFPGLWLDVNALLRRDLATVLGALQRGLASAEHAAFVQLLRQQRI